MQNKVNSLSETREFYDPETASTRTMPCRDSGLPHDARNIMSTSGRAIFLASSISELHLGKFPDSVGNSKLESQLNE